MPVRDDGDIVRAIGYLAIYFTNLEDAVDELIQSATASRTWAADPDIDKRNFRDRLRHIKRGFRDAFAARRPYEYMDYDQRMVAAVMSACKQAAKDRNAMLHLPIFGDPHNRGRTFQRLRDGRQNLLRSSQVYNLANRVSDLDAKVYGLRFVLMHILTKPDL